MVKVSKINVHNVPPEEALQEFLLLRKAEGVSETTLNNHHYHITKFIKRSGTWDNMPNAIIEHMTEDMSNWRLPDLSDT